MYELYDVSQPGLDIPNQGDYYDLDVSRFDIQPTNRDASGLALDGRRWAEDWVFFPMSTNVFAARYARDGMPMMQVMYGGKFRPSGNYSRTFSPIRLYEYGPKESLTYEMFVEFLLSSSKGSFSWNNLDPRRGNNIPFRQLT